MPAKETGLGPVVVLVAAMLCPVTAAAGLFDQAVAGGTDSPAAPAAAGGATLTLGGHLRSGLFAGKAGNRAEVKSGYGECALQLGLRAGSLGRARGELRLAVAHESGELETRTDLREAHVDLYLGPLDLRLGQQIIVWGRADGINPTDNLTPLDLSVFSPEEDDRRKGNLALRAHLDMAPLRLEGVWIPLFSATTLPDFDVPEQVELAAPRYPGPGLEHGTWAARVHLLLPAVDLSFSYLLGRAPLPTFHVVTDSDETPRVGLRSHRRQVVGADMATTLPGRLGLRAELAYRHPLDDPEQEWVPARDLRYVVGLDRELWGQLSVILQYVGSWIANPNDLRSAPDRPLAADVRRYNRMLVGQTARLQHGGTLRVSWSLLHETLTLEALATGNLTTEEWLLRLEARYRITDSLAATVGGLLLLGPQGTLYGLLEQRRSSIFAELELAF